MKSLASFLFLISLICLSLAGCQSGTVQRTPQLPICEATAIVPYLDHAVPETDNLIYCTTFQIAWNELTHAIIKEDISMENEPSMVAMLNRGIAGSVSEKDFVSMAGFGRDNIVTSINQELERKFGESAPSVDVNLEEDDILAYAYLFKNLLFAEEFEELSQTLFFQGSENADVEAFGIKKYEPTLHDKMGEQVIVLDYVDDLDFIIQLATTSSTDELILAMVEPQKTLLETFEAVEARIAKSKPGGLRKDDVLKIPKITFGIEHSYDELLNKTLKNKGFTDYFIAKAFQSIRFRFDQKGALLESEAEVMLKKNGDEARYFVFNEPFLLYLKEKGAHYPYLAIWINNPEILVKGGLD